MNTPIKTLSDKIMAIFFSVCLVLVCMCLFLCIRCLKQYHIYSDGGEYAKQYQLRVETEALSDEAVNYYYCTLQSKATVFNGENAQENIFVNQVDTYAEAFSKDNSNMFFEIKNSEGEIVFGTKNLWKDTDYQYSCSYPYMINYIDENGDAQTDSGIITCYVAAMNAEGKFPAKYDDSYSTAFRWIDLSAKTGILLFLLLAVVAIAAAFLIGLLLCSAGSTDEDGMIIARFVDRVPLDLYAATVLFISLFAIGSIKLTNMSEETLVSEHSVILIVTLVIAALVVALLLSIAVRIKLAAQNPKMGVFKNTLIYKLIALIRNRIDSSPKVKSKKEKSKSKIRTSLGDMTTMISIVKFLGCVSLLYFAYIDIAKEQPNWHLYIIIWVVGHALILPLYFMLSYNIDKLQKGWKNLAEGKLDTSIDSSGMFGVFKDISKNLEEVRRDMNRAYDTEAKSQLLRNELITNVSHDIKTPLTSIVNYVGLLKKDESISESSKEYIEVLDFQAEKLKKLLDNLIEASKASSGNVTVNPEIMDVRFLLEQTAAEYVDILKNQNLQLNLKLPETETLINVDGHLMWRVFENLMSNIGKYAEEATEVLISLETHNEKAIITFSNVSKYRYDDEEGDKLLGRFVRGDSSRHTEGNGLGMSIASNLTVLQKGTFEVSTSNDCFCVILTFDIYSQNRQTDFADREEIK